jgi:hypothetical protein
MIINDLPAFMDQGKALVEQSKAFASVQEMKRLRNMYGRG